jgi:ABC-type multidrug transport system ATPase subunit
MPRRVAIGFQKETTKEHLYLFVKDLKSLHHFASEYESEAELFKSLESTYISELISEVRIRVKIRGLDGHLTFRELSEGEQQLLIVFGLLKFTKEKDSLFLLDEPDTHLNPAWSQQYLELLQSVVGQEETSHIIIATHDPLLLAGLRRSQVQIMRRDDGGRIFAEIPDQDPMGMGIAAILTSDIYGLRSDLDLETIRRLDKKRLLATKPDLSHDEKQELAELNKQLAHLGFTSSFRDPLFEDFEKAMAAEPEYQSLQKQVLTKKEKARLSQLASASLKKMKAKQEKS